MLQFDVVTLFPAMFDAVTELGVTGRARERGLYQFVAWNPRDFTTNVHRTVDDRPYGGGPGMVMMAEPLDKALAAARQRQMSAGVDKSAGGASDAAGKIAGSRACGRVGAGAGTGVAGQDATKVWMSV